MPTTIKQHLGTVAVIDIAGPTTYVIPVATAVPQNPYNKGYPALANASGFPTIVNYGKRTPGLMISTVLKQSWCTATFLNNLLFVLDSWNNTREHAIILYDNSGIQYGNCDASHTGMRIFTGGRCSMLTLFQNAAGGPIGVEMYFNCIAGESEADASVVNSFSPTIPAASVGQVQDVTHTAFSTSGALVRSWRLTLVRAQGWQAYCDGSYFMAEVASGGFSGTFTVEQSPRGVGLGTGQVITIRKLDYTTHFTITTSWELDEPIQDFSIGLGNVVRSYTLINPVSPGGNPCIIA